MSSIIPSRVCVLPPRILVLKKGPRVCVTKGSSLCTAAVAMNEVGESSRPATSLAEARGRSFEGFNSKRFAQSAGPLLGSL